MKRWAGVGIAGWAAVAAVLASGNGGGKINLDQVVKQNVNDQIDALKQVVEDNTK